MEIYRLIPQDEYEALIAASSPSALNPFVVMSQISAFIGMNTNRLLGRYNAGVGAAEEITIGAGLSLSAGGVLSSTVTGGVTSFNTRTGAVVPQAGDYTTTIVAEGTNLYYTDTRFDTRFATKSTTDLVEGTNLYYTNARVLGAVLTGFVAGAGTITAADSVLSAFQKSAWNIAVNVTAIGKLQSTRFISGAGVTINADPTKFDIAAVGEYVNPNTFAATPITVALTAISATHIAAQAESYVWVDNTSTVIQSLTPPDPTILSDIVGFWVLVHSDLSTISIVNSFPFYADGLATQLNQILHYIGFKRFPGTNVVSEGTTGTRISHTGGNVIKSGGGNTTKLPVFTLTGAVDDALLRMRNRTDVEGADTNTVDVLNIDVAGVTTALASNSLFGAHKVWKFSSSRVRVQRGQYSYGSYAAAMAGIYSDTYVDSPNGSRNGIHIGWIVFRRNTSWGAGGTGTIGIDYQFVDITTAGGGGSVSTLQGAYDASTQPQVLTDSTRGALQVKRGSAADTDSVIEVVPGASSTAAYKVTGEGVVYKATKRTNGGNANYNILTTDQNIYTGTVFSAARIWTLPTAATVPAGTPMIISDELGTITTTNTLTIAVQTGEKLNGTINGTEIMTTAMAERIVRSNGVDGWYIDISIVRLGATQRLTNKRLDPRVLTIVSSATPTINTDTYDHVDITALAAAITSMTTNLSGTPVNFQRLIFRIKDNGTARAITWGASFEALGVALPTTTTINKRLTVGFIWDSTTSKWGCVAALVEA